MARTIELRPGESLILPDGTLIRAARTASTAKPIAVDLDSSAASDGEMLPMRRVRDAIGMGQAEFAEALGCNQSSVSQFENGRIKPSIETALKLIGLCTARGLDLSLDHVYGVIELPVQVAAGGEG